MRKWIIAITVLAASQVVNDYKYSNDWLESKELQCLADNVYHEARGEPWRGQVLVARVTLNRATNTTICYEVYKHKQFSWTLKKKIRHNRLSPEYYLAWQAANAARSYQHPATFYHNTKVSPRWAKSLVFLEKFNNHIFYK